MADPRVGKPTPAQVTALGGSYLSESIYANTVFDYLFNEGDGIGGTTVDDISGNSLTATSVNTLAADWQDTGLLLAGATAQSARTSSSALLNLTGDLSVEIWFKMNTWSSQQLAFIIAGGTGETEAENICIFVNTGGGASPNINLRYNHENGAGVNNLNVFSSALSTGTIYHIAFVRDVSANTVKMYVDGSFLATYAYTNDPTLTADGILCISGDVAGDLSGAANRTYYRVHGADRVWSDAEVLELFDDPWGVFGSLVNRSNEHIAAIRKAKRRICERRHPRNKIKHCT